VAPVVVQEACAPVLSWVDPGGTVWYLSDRGAGFDVQVGVAGLDSPTWTHHLDESPAVDGAFWRGSRADSRRIIFRVFVHGGSRSEALERRRALIRAFSPHRGMGTLVVAEPDGTYRSIDGYKSAGMEGDLSPEEAGGTWAKYTVELTCPQPYFYGPARQLSFGNDAQPAFLPLLLPFRLPTARLIGDASALNDGDVPAWPQWTAHGPLTRVYLRNRRMFDAGLPGHTLDLTVTRTAGQSVTIDTRPGRKTIVDDGGVNRWSGLADGSALWPLLEGDNDITITLDGAGSGTRADLTYEPRHLSA
jgi:hypothetical protein